MIAHLLRKRASSRAHRRLDSWWPSPPHCRQCFPGQSIPGPQYKYFFLPCSAPISKFPCRPEVTPHRCSPRKQSIPANRSTKNGFEADVQAEWGFIALWHAIAMVQQCDLCFLYVSLFLFPSTSGYVHMVLQRLLWICSSSLFGLRVSVKLLWELRVGICMIIEDVTCKTSMLPYSVQYLKYNDNNQHDTSRIWSFELRNSCNHYIKGWNPNPWKLGRMVHACMHVKDVDANSHAVEGHSTLRWDVPNSVTYLDWPPCLEWHVVGCESKNGHHKDMCFNKIGLHVQNMLIVR